mmetsp:Transcript_38870/g.67233  ORF Transcript_38870/g.67233 Transcript_38870/m.67233 type:complete len:128 (+) Transcript_38870:4522-4905(+)
MYGTGVDGAGGAGGACDGICTISHGFAISEIDELASTASELETAGDKGNGEASCEAALIRAASITDTGAGAAAGGGGAGADGIGGGGGGELGTGEEEPRRGGGGFVSGKIPTPARATSGVSDKIAGT